MERGIDIYTRTYIRGMQLDGDYAWYISYDTENPALYYRVPWCSVYANNDCSSIDANRR